MTAHVDDPYAPPPASTGTTGLRYGGDVLPAAQPARELRVAVLTTLYVTLLGPLAGLLWGAVAPRLDVTALLTGSDATYHPQIGADAWFLLVGALAGALCVALAVLLAGEPGPGMTVGLALGGMAAAFVADRVGYLSQRGELSSMLRTLRAVGVHPGGSLVSQIDFRIRALGVLTVWPLVSLALVGVVIAIRAARR